MIIGNGTYNSVRLDGKAEQKTYSVGHVGGEMEHKLTTDEIPAHDHSNG
jgi:microcystin-dependent protein